MAKKHQSGSGRGRTEKREASQTAEDGRQAQHQKRQPSKKSGLISVIMGMFGMLWTVAAYLQKGPGMAPLFGLIFVFFCMIHASYNFQGVKRREMAQREGNAWNPEAKRAEEGASGGKTAGAEESKDAGRPAGLDGRKAGEEGGASRYPIYNVKARPARKAKRRQ